LKLRFILLAIALLPALFAEVFVWPSNSNAWADDSVNAGISAVCSPFLEITPKLIFGPCRTRMVDSPIPRSQLRRAS